MYTVKPIAVYLCVSTGRQDLRSRWVTIEAWAKARGINIDERIVEEELVNGVEVGFQASSLHLSSLVLNNA